MKKHFYDVEVAQIVGINAAILLENISHWCEHNAANNTNLHDGHYWTYNSIKAFGTLFPEMTANAIRTSIKKLKDAGLIITGNWNKSSYDRTQWYALTEKAETLLDVNAHSDEPENEATTPEAPADPTPATTPTQDPWADISNANATQSQLPIREPEPQPKKTRKAKSFDAIIDGYTSDPQTKDLIGAWLQNRKAKRSAMTDRAIQGNIDKLDQCAQASRMSVNDYLNEVICRGWSAFYPIEDYRRNGYQQQPRQQQWTRTTEEQRKHEEAVKEFEENCVFHF